MEERLIFHVDVNSAFLSWEAARRVKEGLPDLREIPSCIGGDPKSRRGIVVAKSIPAKKYGVTTGEPVALALRKCPDLVCVPGDFALFDRCSRAFKKICASYAPVMESFSIDEVFLDMSGTHLIYPDPVAVAHEIKDKIRDVKRDAFFTDQRFAATVAKRMKHCFGGALHYQNACHIANGPCYHNRLRNWAIPAEFHTRQIHRELETDLFPGGIDNFTNG